MSQNRKPNNNKKRRPRRKNPVQQSQQQQRKPGTGPSTALRPKSVNNIRRGAQVLPLTNPGSMNSVIAKRDYDTSWRRYIQAIIEPESVGKGSMVNREMLSDVRIPDTCLFPCTIAQTKTTGTISPDSSGGFIMWAYPYMKQGFNFYSTDGAANPISTQCNDFEFTGNATYDIYGYESWFDAIESYRVISMSVRMWYVGTLLNSRGKLVGACLSPFSQDKNTFSELAEVPYSFQSTITDGIRQIWFPFDYQSVEAQSPDSEPGFDHVPSITIIGANINGYDATTPEYTVQFEIIVNYEIYSNSQLFNNKAISNSSHILSGPVAKATAAKVIAKNGGGTTSKSNDILSFIKDAVGVAETVAKVASPLLALL